MRSVLLVTLPAFALANVGISVAMYRSNDCTGNPSIQRHGREPLTDLRTLVSSAGAGRPPPPGSARPPPPPSPEPPSGSGRALQETSPPPSPMPPPPSGSATPRGMCMNFENRISFMGSCPALSTTQMQRFRLETNTLVQDGLRYCWMSNGDCSGRCTSSAIFPVESWEVPLCKSCQEIFGGPCQNGIRSIGMTCGDTTCFPSAASVTLADGRAVPISSLRAGDSILAAKADGSLYHDVVSRFSLAQPETRAAFLRLTTDKAAALSLTADHHLPVGPHKQVTQAKNVAVGDTIWLAEGGTASSLEPQAVVSIDVTIEQGLHNPLLVHGGMPIVDGIATSFNAAPIVALDSYAVPVVEGLCAATGTCAPVRRAIAAVECAAKHLVAANPVCKTFHYVDGVIAGGKPGVDPLVAGAVALGLVLVTALSVRARK